MIKGEKSDGQSSSYVYNALGVRIQNTQIRKNKNKGYENFKLDNGSEFLKDYLKALSDGRATNQRVWETEVGTTVQNDYETVKKNYTVDYLSVANREILVDEEGSYLQKYVYDEHGRCISGEFSHTDGTKRGTKNKEGKYGENISSDNAVDKIKKVWFHSNHINSKLFATSGAGETIAHMERDAWGMPDFDTYTDINYSGLESMNDYTGYTLDECLGLYFAQNRFYDPENMRFIQEDIIKDGDNWYTYVENNPLVNIDWYGTFVIKKDPYNEFKIPLKTHMDLVEDAQRKLVDLGYLDMQGNEFGIYGGLTSGAIAHFQFNYGLEITGHLNSETALLIHNAHLKNIKKRRAYAKKKDYERYREKIKNIDKKLSMHDYYPKYKCNLVQNPHMNASEQRIELKCVRGKYYMDYTEVIDNILRINEEKFEVLSLDEYNKQYASDFANNRVGGYERYYVDRMLWFAMQMKPKSTWDLKYKPSWEKMFNGELPYYAQKFPFIYRGEIINSEILGNIAYGYLGSSMGYSEKLLQSASQGVSVIFSSGRDDFEDTLMVQRGILYYKYRRK